GALAQGTESAEARVNAQRDELARIRAERDELEKKMNGLQNTAHELRDEVNLLDRQHDATARMVTSLDNQLVAITDEVTTTTTDLQASEREQQQARNLARVQEDAKRAKARLAELEKSEARLNNVIASFEAERRRASGRAGAPALSPSSIRTTDIGRLDWPVNGAFLYR